MSDIIDLKTICAQLKIEPRLARRRLRASKFEAREGRWSFTPAQAAQVKALLKDTPADRAPAPKAKAPKAAKKPDPKKRVTFKSAGQTRKRLTDTRAIPANAVAEPTAA